MNDDTQRAELLAKFCDVCHGTGRYVWGSTAMGGGIGGQTMTEGPCPGKARSAFTSMCPVYLRERLTAAEVECRTSVDRIAQLEAELAAALSGDQPNKENQP